MVALPFVLAATLVADGVPKCRIVVDVDADPAVRFGAAEISKYLGVSSGANVEVNPAAGRLLPVTVRTASRAEAAELREDGFFTDVRPQSVEIVGANPRGALYGCYDLLKRAAGVRWLMPGDDGEYVPKRRTIEMPDGRTVRNPYLAIRECRGGGINFWLWSARNNLLSTCSRKAYGEDPRMAELAVRPCADGSGHILSALLLGWGGSAERKAESERLFAAHPEYFPLLKGKRERIDGPLSPNPCVSNPEVVEIMASNLWQLVRSRTTVENYLTIGNNDSKTWCECPQCRALDAPEAEGTKGARSDRYWHLLNELGRRIWEKDPGVRLGGWAYQNFWYPPRHVKIDPRFKVLVSFNNQCWRHSVASEKCPVNSEFRNILAAWKATGLPLVVNRDEISATGAPGSTYSPAETVFAANARAYPSLGLSGSHVCTTVPEPDFLKWAERKPPYYGRNLRWPAIWQTVYLAAQVMWDRDADIRALYDEANRLYYGRGWEAGFRDFQKIRTRAFLSAPGCIGWGEGASIAAAAQGYGVMSGMRASLAAAIDAVKKDGDARSLRHLERDREIFEATWGVAHSNMLAKAREFCIERAGGGTSDSFHFGDVVATGTYDDDVMSLRFDGAPADGKRLAVSLAYTGDLAVAKEYALAVRGGCATLSVSAADAGRGFRAGQTWRISVGGRSADMKLIPGRSKWIWGQGLDPAAWQNGSFSSFSDGKPSGWKCHGGVKPEVVEEDGNVYLRLGGVPGPRLSQSFMSVRQGEKYAAYGDAMRLKATFRVRGKGSATIKGFGSDLVLELSPEWTWHSVETAKSEPSACPRLQMTAASDSTLDIDDVYVNPAD